MTFILVSCSSPELQLTVVERAPLPEPRAAATAFAVGHQAFVFSGRDTLSQCRNDLFRYDADLDQWTVLGPVPLLPRVNASAAVVGNDAYIGLGFDGRYGNDSCYFRDFWRYTPSSNTWTRLADYPSFSTDAAVIFAEGDIIYVGFGFHWKYERNFYRYHISSDTWDSIPVHLSANAFPARCFGSVGAACQGRFYVGTGYHVNSLSQWAEFFPEEARYEKRHSVPGARNASAAVASEDFVYVIGGQYYGGVLTDGRAYDDVLRYDPQKDSWVIAAHIPDEGLFNHVVFRIDHRIYFGFGENRDYRMVNRLFSIEE